MTAAPTAAAHAEVAFQTGKKWIELLPWIKLMPPTRVGGSTNGLQERHAQRCPVWKGDFGVGSSVGAALAEHSYYRGIVRDEAIARAS